MIGRAGWVRQLFTRPAAEPRGRPWGPAARGDAVRRTARLDLGIAGPWRWVSEPLHVAYLLYYPLIYVPPALLWLGWTGPRAPVERGRAFHRTVLGLTLAALACFAVMVLLPVQGPRYLGSPAGVPDGPARRLVPGVLETGSSRGAAFPSAHVAVAVVQTLLALRWQPRVGIVCAAVTLPLAIGTVYGGFHYLVDALAGAAIGGAAAVFALHRGSRNPLCDPGLNAPGEGAGLPSDRS